MSAFQNACFVIPAPSVSKRGIAGALTNSLPLYRLYPILKECDLHFGHSTTALTSPNPMIIKFCNYSEHQRIESSHFIVGNFIPSAIAKSREEEILKTSNEPQTLYLLLIN
ncbi:MAG: hypothetical protein WAW61_03510 [Methylococcaceae bacterium]